jgi:hypothetical protein
LATNSHICKLDKFCVYETVNTNNKIHCDICHKIVSNFEIAETYFNSEFGIRHSIKFNGLKKPLNNKIETKYQIIKSDSHKNSNFIEYKSYYKCSIENLKQTKGLNLSTRILLIDTPIETLKYPFQIQYELESPLTTENKSFFDLNLHTIMSLLIVASIIAVIIIMLLFIIKSYFWIKKDKIMSNKMIVFYIALQQQQKDNRRLLKILQKLVNILKKSFINLNIKVIHSETIQNRIDSLSRCDHVFYFEIENNRQTQKIRLGTTNFDDEFNFIHSVKQTSKVTDIIFSFRKPLNNKDIDGESLLLDKITDGNITDSAQQMNKRYFNLPKDYKLFNFELIEIVIDKQHQQQQSNQSTKVGTFLNTIRNIFILKKFSTQSFIRTRILNFSFR